MQRSTKDFKRISEYRNGRLYPLMASLSYLKKKLIQMFLDNLMIIGKKRTSVATIAIKVVESGAPRMRYDITKVTVANAMPTA